MPSVSIVSTGVANLASICAAFDRMDCAHNTVQTADDITAAEYLVLPGVGAFGAAMSALWEKQLVDALKQRILEGKPTLAVCLGMQLFCASSDETPGVAGLSIISQNVQRLNAAGLTIPQMGWNTAVPKNDFNAFESGHAYFANSYGIPAVNLSDWQIAEYQYGQTYIAAMQYRRVLACQFHPELSGAWGHHLIQNWLEAA